MKPRVDNLFHELAPAPAPQSWANSCAHDECTLHQLSPYIGKLKSSIAKDLIKAYSKAGDLVVDPFSGAGTVPLEAVINGRRTFAADISPYSKILTLAKLFPPRSLDDAIGQCNDLLAKAEGPPAPDLRKIPLSVRKFFHPETLKEALNFAAIARRPGNEFFMACFLGILHHQRPGFLSYPCSHLVPYLRDKKYPREKFPEMYAYRELKPRLIAKIVRSFKRFSMGKTDSKEFILSPVQKLDLPNHFDALITSPPYMNALDYGRDNRLRLWFIDPTLTVEVDNDVTERRQAFIEAISNLGQKVEFGLRPRRYCILVVGEEVSNRSGWHPSELVESTFRQVAPSLKLEKVLRDKIPDIRRTRRKCRGVKNEHFLIFQKK